MNKPKGTSKIRGNKSKLRQDYVGGLEGLKKKESHKGPGEQHGEDSAPGFGQLIAKDAKASAPGQKGLRKPGGQNVRRGKTGPAKSLRT